MESILQNLIAKGRRTLPYACSVCFGNAHSPMSKGVVAGVVLMIAVVAGVLTGIVCVGLVWLRRAKKGPNPITSR